MINAIRWSSSSGTLSERIAPTIHSMGMVTRVPTLVVISGRVSIACNSAVRSRLGP